MFNKRKEISTPLLDNHHVFWQVLQQGQCHLGGVEGVCVCV